MEFDMLCYVANKYITHALHMQSELHVKDLTLDLSPSTCCQSTSGSTVSPFRAILY